MLEVDFQEKSGSGGSMPISFKMVDSRSLRCSISLTAGRSWALLERSSDASSSACSLACSSASTSGGARSAKFISPSFSTMLIISAPYFCRLVSFVERKFLRAFATPRSFPTVLPRGTPMEAKPSLKPSCSAASFPAVIPSRYPAYKIYSELFHGNDEELTLVYSESIFAQS